MKKTLTYAVALLLAVGCTVPPASLVPSDEPVPMYPDYTDVTVPVNVAPLNFLLRDTVSRIVVKIDGATFVSSRESQVRFSERRWHELLSSGVGRTLDVAVCVKRRGEWKEYRHFGWTVSPDRIDPYLTYRLTEPDYEAYNNLVLQQRCTETFETENLCDYEVIGNKCMNCHTYAGQNPDRTMFYVRGKDGGAILNRGGALQKLNIKADGMSGGSVYFGFSPSGKYVTFSTNTVYPGYNSRAGKRMEVFDVESDLYVADIEAHTIIASDLLTGPDALETFPCFSPDGRHIYFCTAAPLDTTTLDSVRKLHYSLCRIDFDESTGTIGTHIDTIYNARLEGSSVCHPRISPDGRFICLTLADYGTFPLWHGESDLYLIETATGRLIPMTAANSGKSDTYHSWSSSSRWLVFASKRDDGQYGKPYFTHIDEDGHCTKALLLPQKYPDFYDNTLKSFNTIESGTGPLPFSTYDVKDALQQPPVPFRLIRQ